MLIYRSTASIGGGNCGVTDDMVCVCRGGNERTRRYKILQSRTVRGIVGSNGELSIDMFVLFVEQKTNTERKR